MPKSAKPELTLQEKLAKANDAATTRIATLRFGKRGPYVEFIEAVHEFMESSPDRAADQAYIIEIYKAITALQHRVIANEPTDAAKNALKDMLYAPARERFLSPGMQTASIFTDNVVTAAAQIRDKIVGKPRT